MAARGEQWRPPPLLHFIFLSTSLKKERKGFKTGIAMISAVKIKIAKSTTVTSRSCEVSQLKKKRASKMVHRKIVTSPRFKISNAISPIEAAEHKIEIDRKRSPLEWWRRVKEVLR